MDLFSQLNQVSLPGIDNPGYVGRWSSVCHLASKWFGYTDFTYRLAEAADQLSWQYDIAQHRMTGKPVTSEEMTAHLKQAIKYIYRHG